MAAIRPAGPTDVPEIARIQYETWRTAYAGLLPDRVLAGLDVAEAEQAWRHTIDEGPATVYIATEGAWTVGFCAAGPAPRTASGAPGPWAAGKRKAAEIIGSHQGRAGGGYTKLYPACRWPPPPHHDIVRREQCQRRLACSLV